MALLDPFPVDEFVDEYRDRSHLVVTRERPDLYADLLDLATVEAFLFESNPRVQDLQVLREGPLDRSEYLYPSGLVDSLALCRLYEDGCSIVVPQAHQHFPPLTYLVRGLEAELGSRVQANVYMSPPGSAAFAPHYDSHDVLVLQAHGAKDWTLFECAEPVPVGREFDPDRDSPGPAIDTFTLRSGDLCYLPRGLMHHATATEEVSLHATVGIHWVSVVDALRALLDQAGTERHQLRRALPVRWWVDDSARRDAAQAVRQALTDLGDEDLLAAALGHLRADLVSTRQPLVPGQLGQVRRIDEIDLSTQVAARDPMLWDLDIDQDQTVLSCFGSEIAFPVKVSKPLLQLLTTDGIAVGELTGDLDDAEKLVLVRRLVREGVVFARW